MYDLFRSPLFWLYAGYTLALAAIGAVSVATWRQGDRKEKQHD